MLAEGFSTRRGRRAALVHHDAVNYRVRGRRGALLTALTSGGAIPDNADYRVLMEPGETLIGTVNEDFAIESMAGESSNSAIIHGESCKSIRARCGSKTRKGNRLASLSGRRGTGTYRRAVRGRLDIASEIEKKSRWTLERGESEIGGPEQPLVHWLKREPGF